MFDLLQNSYHSMSSLAGQAFIHFKLITKSFLNLFSKLFTKFFTKLFTKYLQIYKIFLVSLLVIRAMWLTCKAIITFLSDLFCTQPCSVLEEIYSYCKSLKQTRTHFYLDGYFLGVKFGMISFVFQGFQPQMFVKVFLTDPQTFLFHPPKLFHSSKKIKHTFLTLTSQYQVNR